MVLEKDPEEPYITAVTDEAAMMDSINDSLTLAGISAFTISVIF
jgi:hypothetical protein